MITGTRNIILRPIFYCLFLLACFAWIPDAATGALYQIAIQPENPTASDQISVVIDGEYPTPCWTVDSWELNGPVTDTLWLEMFTSEHGPGCILVIQPFTVEYQLGQLPAGQYTLALNEHREPWYGWGPSALEITFTVTVSIDTEKNSWGTVKALYR